MRPTDNTILITGGTSGIGRALAERLHARGNTVIVAGRRQPLLDDITAKNPGMHGIAVDLGNAAAIDAFAADVRARFPAINVLFNNAGISIAENLAGDVTDLSVARAILDVNVIGVLHLTAALLPALKRQPNAAVVTTTSGLAFLPAVGFPTYSASKAFLHSWLQSLRAQLRATNVAVLELAPPYVQTELTGPGQAVDPHAMPLADYADEVMRVLEAGDLPHGEILVERTKPLRWAERDGTYDDVFAALNKIAP